MLPAAALIALTIAATFSSAPPRFQVDSTGRATDGQVVKDGARPRVQRIAILPDRTTGRAWGMPYLLAAVEDLNIVRPDAVFTVGDMVQGYTRSTTLWNSEADQYLQAVGGLTPAFYPTAGNHDVISGTRTAGDATFAERYRQRFGPVWYSVELDLATVLVLFSDEGLGDSKMGFSDTQIAWLSGALDSAAKRGQPIFLLMHRPMWRYPSVKWNDRVQPLLEKAGVDAVIAGHFHALQRDPDVGGVQYHIVGTCGGMIDQHPLAGQLQHLTFVDCTSDGALRVWHQPVGLVLPEDFITRADQDRVFALREPVPAVHAVGMLTDPTTLTAPTKTMARLVAKNPTDVPIHITLDPPGVLRSADGPAVWFTAGRAGRGTPGTTGGMNGWTSHTLADIDNASTMANNARAVLQVAPGACDRTIPAKGEATIEVPMTLLPQSGTVLAPQLDVYATFVDSKGRTVPIYLPTRLPIERTIQLSASLQDATPLPVLAWDYSPYDTREDNPTLRFARSEDGKMLVIDALVPDDVQSSAPQWSAPDLKHLTDPHADAIRIIVDVPGRASPLDLLIEPFTAGCTVPDGVRMQCGTRAGTGWTAHIEVPLAAGAAANTSIQVGIADNDDTFHTQWRWLAPAGAAGRWRMAEPQSRSK
ncbi:MAG: metallophosphoesterase [Planctomycetota bacterium]|nr:metallophosphoesterase [Planctomycetota bacterium]